MAFGVNVSPFLLNDTLQNHIRNYFIDQDFVKKLLDSFCVDDFNSRESKVDNAFQLYQKTRTCLSDGGFHLRKWASNSSELMEKIKQEREDRNVRCAEGSKSSVSDEDTSFAKITVGGWKKLMLSQSIKFLV